MKELNPRKDSSGNYYDPMITYALNFWNHYIVWFSLSIHFMIMYYGMSNWCGGSKIAMAYTF